MFLPSLLIITGFVASVAAHFQLQYPAPRGPFVEDQEPTFCDGYTNAVSNRTVFPLDNGFITLNSEHPMWNLAVLISVEQNPTNFTVFNTSTTGVKLPFVVPFFQTTGEGMFCIPLDIGSWGIPGVQSGSNVTIQAEFDGGDGQLFQCADLTLSNTATAPSNVQCTNVVGNTSTSTSSSTSSASTPSKTSGTSPTANLSVLWALGLVLGAGVVSL